ncbi:MAG: host attachment protein [Alphaproteobacteria bacterium]|nr:host attachment protein [Alphaproteobacteria bacterium]
MIVHRKVTTWMLVADGARARLFANHGPKTGLTLVQEESSERARLQAREIMADKPGRSMESAGGGLRHGVAYRTDPQELAKQKFLRHLADIRTEGRRCKAFEHLVLVAPPHALGELRSQIDKHTMECVSVEIGKDLTRVPEHDLPRHLSQAIKL